MRALHLRVAASPVELFIRHYEDRPYAIVPVLDIIAVRYERKVRPRRGVALLSLINRHLCGLSKLVVIGRFLAGTVYKQDLIQISSYCQV